MDHSITFARHYARLLWLLLHEATNVDEQKVSLRALVTVSKDGAVVLSSTGEELTANGAPVPRALSGVAELGGRMLAHGVEAIAFDAGSAAAGMLGSARVLAAETVAGDGGASAVSGLAALNVPSVRFSLRAAAARTEPGVLPDFGFGDVEVLDEEAVQAKLRPTPRATVVVPSSGESRSEGGMFEQFTATRAPTASHPELLAQLEQGTGVGVLTRVLDDLVAIAEAAARDARPALVCEILCRVTRREPQIHEFESKRAFVMALRRLAKPQLLRAITQELPHAGDQHEAFIAVLTRAGEDGADALIEQIAAISGQNERRGYFDALLQIQSGITTLIP